MSCNREWELLECNIEHCFRKYVQQLLISIASFFVAIAAESSDFTSLTTVQRFSLSRSRVCVNININYDCVNEGTESFTVRLTGQNLPSYVHLTRSSTTVQIRNVYSELVLLISYTSYVIYLPLLPNGGAEIGLERSTYSVNEDAGSVAVCAAITCEAIASWSSLSLTFNTASGSMFLCSC